MWLSTMFHDCLCIKLVDVTHRLSPSISTPFWILLWVLYHQLDLVIPILVASFPGLTSPYIVPVPLVVLIFIMHISCIHTQECNPVRRHWLNIFLAVHRPSKKSDIWFMIKIVESFIELIFNGFFFRS